MQFLGLVEVDITLSLPSVINCTRVIRVQCSPGRTGYCNSRLWSLQEGWHERTFFVLTLRWQIANFADVCPYKYESSQSHFKFTGKSNRTCSQNLRWRFSWQLDIELSCSFPFHAAQRTAFQRITRSLTGFGPRHKVLKEGEPHSRIWLSSQSECLLRASNLRPSTEFPFGLGSSGKQIVTSL